MDPQMYIRKFSPGPALRPYARSYYIFELQGVDQLFYVPAWAKTMLIFHYGDRFAFRYEDGRELWTSPALLMGNTTVPFSYGQDPALRVKFFAVEFHPLVLKSLVGESLTALTDNTIALEDLGRKDAAWIPDALDATGTDQEKIAIVEGYLQGLFDGRLYTPPGAAREIMHRLYSSKGTADLRQLARDLGMSDRHLRRVFKELTGVAPKKYSMLLRAEYILRRLFQEQDVNHVDLAQEFGYYDQAHFIHEFKNTTLATPGEMSREQYLESVRFFYS